jgi:polyisoprenoid-binding protein YceI
MHYKIQRGAVEVRAKSALHDTTTKFGKVEGTIDFDPDAPASAQCDIRVDMRVFDAGDTFKNWKLKGDLDAETYPTATFILARFDDVHEVTAGAFTATATGQIKWRDHTPIVKVKGKATVDRRSIDARASFDLDVRQLGIAPPKFLMFKVDEIVAVQASVFAFVVDR